MKCAVWNCYNNGNGSKRCSSFRFPKDPQLVRKWLQFCQSENEFNEKSWRICIEHFKEDDIDGNLKFQMGWSTTRRLKPGAIPCINKNYNLKRLQNNNKKNVAELLKNAVTGEITSEAESDDVIIVNDREPTEVIQVNGSDSEEDMEIDIKEIAKEIQNPENESNELKQFNGKESNEKMQDNENEPAEIMQYNEIQLNKLNQVNEIASDEVNQVDENVSDETNQVNEIDSDKIMQDNEIDLDEINQVNEIASAEVNQVNEMESVEVQRINETELDEMMPDNRNKLNEIMLDNRNKSDDIMQVRKNECDKEMHGHDGYIDKIIKLLENKTKKVIESGNVIEVNGSKSNEIIDINKNVSENVIPVKKSETDKIVHIDVVIQVDKMTQVDETELDKVIQKNVTHSDNEAQIMVQTKEVIEVNETVEVIQAEKMTQVNFEDLQQNNMTTSKKLWKSLQDIFQIELKKYLHGLEIGEPYKSAWPHFESLLFLKSHMITQQPNKNTSPIKIELSDDDEFLAYSTDIQTRLENHIDKNTDITSIRQPENTASETNQNESNQSRMQLDNDDDGADLDVTKEIEMILENNIDKSTDIPSINPTESTRSKTNQNNSNQILMQVDDNPDDTPTKSNKTDATDLNLNHSIKFEQEKLLFLKSLHNRENDEDYHFLMSFHQSLKHLQPMTKMFFRMKVQELMYKCMAEDAQNRLENMNESNQTENRLTNI